MAENDCKEFSTEPEQGDFNLTACLAIRDYAYAQGIAFRGSVSQIVISGGVGLLIALEL